MPLDINLKRLALPSLCGGSWTCLEAMCEAQEMKNASYALVRNLYLSGDQSQHCKLHAGNVLSWLWEFSSIKACFVFLGLAILFEVFNIALIFSYRPKLWALLCPVLFLLTSWVCYYVYLGSYSKNFGDSAPSYILVFQVLASTLSWVAIVVSRILLVQNLKSPSLGYTEM